MSKINKFWNKHSTSIIVTAFLGLSVAFYLQGKKIDAQNKYQQTLHYQIGGKNVIEALIDRLMIRLCTDEVLGPRYLATSPNNIIVKYYMMDFFSEWLGGPYDFTKRPLISASLFSKISDTDLERFCQMVEEIQVELGVRLTVAKAVRQIISDNSEAMFIQVSASSRLID